MEDGFEVDIRPVIAEDPADGGDIVPVSVQGYIARFGGGVVANCATSAFVVKPHPQLQVDKIRGFASGELKLSFHPLIIWTGFQQTQQNTRHH